jgi:UTP--glucose-1-phosphate uridylyltransferase
MNFPKIKRAVFPVAGFGTRFLPVTKSQPKEMLPVVDKPVIQYLVEEAVKSGIEEIIIVTGRGKRAIEDYFDQSFELEHNLVEKGKTDLLREVLEIPNLAKFIYVRQSVPRGDGDAIMQAFNIIKDEPFAVLFGDDLVVHEVPALKQLIQVYEQLGSSVVALTEVADSELSSYGVVQLADPNAENLVITDLVEKPKTKEVAPSNFGVIGKYIITPEVMSVLNQLYLESSFEGELRLADALKKAVVMGIPVAGKLIEGERFDTGSKIGLIKATIDFAMKRDDLGPELKAFMQKYCK